MKLLRRAALYVLVPPALATAGWGVIFLIVVVSEGWSAATEPEELADLRAYVVITSGLGYLFVAFYASLKLVEWWRSRRPARPAQPAQPESSRSLARYWWAPAAFAAVMLVFLAFVGIVASGWREVFGPAALPGLGKLFLFLLALTYVLGGAAMVWQVVSDRARRGAAARAAARTEAGLAAAELGLLRDVTATPRLRSAVAGARRREGRWVTLLVPAAAVYFGYLLASEAGDLSTLLGLGPAGARAVVVGAWALAITAAAAIWWFTVWALMRDVTLMHVTVASSVGADVDDLADAAAAVAGVVPGQLTVTVHGQWRLTRAGLEPVPHVDQRTLDRSRRNAGSVGPGEEAVVICHGATMIGRLADFQDPLDHGVGVSKQRRS